MEITDKAREILNEQIKENNAPGIRVYFAGPGCSTLRFDMSFEGPKENEVVKEINGIQVALDPLFNSYTEKLVIDYSPTLDEVFIKGSSNCG